MNWIDKFFGGKDDSSPKTPRQYNNKDEEHSEVPQPNAQIGNASASEIRNSEMEAYYDGKMSVEEIDYRFKKMEELPEITSLDEELWPKDKGLILGENQPKDLTSPKGAVQPNADTLHNGGAQKNAEALPNTVQPDSATNTKNKIQSNGVNKPKDAKTVYAPRYLEEDTKLTVILVENTDEVAKQKDMLNQIVNNLVVAGKVCVINYGKLVRESKIVEAKDFDCRALLYEEFAGNSACLFDALIALEGVVEKNYKKTEVVKYKRTKTKSIEIIGIGRCIDNCSITSSQIAIESFSKVVKHSDVTTKYFCLSEESFVQAATIGFRSIGAIARNYM